MVRCGYPQEPVPIINAYENFDLLVDQTPGGLRARVIRSLAGEATADFDLPFTEGELAAFFVDTLGIEWGEGTGSAAEPAMDVRRFGQRLYQAVFAGDVATCLLRSLDRATDRQAGLRIRLRLDRGLPRLAALPWEYLYATELQRFLALSDQTPIVRYLEVVQGVQPLEVAPPLVLLAVVSRPQDVPALDVEAEWQRLSRGLAPIEERGLVQVERLAQPWLSSLQQRLRQGPVHLLHFIGHGVFDEATGRGALLFEDTAGKSDVVPAEALGTLLHDHRPLRLAFLSACEGARGGSGNIFAGVAQHLVAQGLPAVLAMQFPVSDRAAVVLSQVFYQSLADGYPADAALSEARKAMAAEGDDREWGTPVLFSRSDNNRLITLPTGDARPSIELQPFEPETMLIPSGPFLMGTDTPPPIGSLEAPQHQVAPRGFRLGRYPVTNRQYAAFIRAEKAIDEPRGTGWFLREPPAERLDHPVTGVSWHDAVAYCHWLSDRTGRAYRLPSEAEWEKAASWEASQQGREEGAPGRQRLYPWGDDWDPSRCNSQESGIGTTTAVGSYGPAGASPYGCEDMAGNVQEWTSTAWGSRKDNPDYVYPYRPDDGREDLATPQAGPGLWRVHRGGSYREDAASLRCTARGASAPDSRLRWRGFRVAMDI
jgi:formylglycine-generating enzyme required for sulfatase activity